ncbi:MAG TPA: transcriptional activator NhaR [Polyangia bacterium]|nr:transcriptional activator NhaR [Polyangia bacterium]
MEWLNYQHLLYFWTVVREGSLTAGAAKLRLAPSTVSGQLRLLESSLGEKLFTKRGRQLVPSEMGRVVHRYADEIFALGSELLDTVRGRSARHAPRLVVGVADVVPKIVARRLLLPAQQLAEPVHLVCREDKPERLMAELALHNLDVVISDAPPPPGSNVRAFGHLLGESGIGFFATRALARRLRRGFPRSLGATPVLLPTENTSLRRSLETWFARQRIEPQVVGEFEDSALLKAFGQDGAAVLPAHTVISAEIERQYGLHLVGEVKEVRESFYAISVERRLTHPGVLAISRSARSELLK